FSATFQIGANKGQAMEVEIYKMDAKALGLQGASGSGHAVGSSVSGLGIAASGTDEVTDAVYAGSGVNNGTSPDSVGSALSVADHKAATAAIKAIDIALETV